MQEEQAEALIVGGGAAGLAAAIELTDLGIEPVVLECRSGPSAHPRATSLTVQAMQLMWRWGVADEISRQGFPQDRLEEILSVRATAGGARIRYCTALIGLRPAGEDVTATSATAEGVSAGIRARYVIGADGARSIVRQSCGITTTRAQQAGHWPAGVHDLPVQVIAIEPFRPASKMADQFRAARVLLAGDAAHVVAPAGGPGLSLALQDGSAAAEAIADALGGGHHTQVYDCRPGWQHDDQSGAGIT